MLRAHMTVSAIGDAGHVQSQQATTFETAIKNEFQYQSADFIFSDNYDRIQVRREYRIICARSRFAFYEPPGT